MLFIFIQLLWFWNSKLDMDKDYDDFFYFDVNYLIITILSLLEEICLRRGLRKECIIRETIFFLSIKSTRRSCMKFVGKWKYIYIFDLLVDWVTWSSLCLLKIVRCIEYVKLTFQFWSWSKVSCYCQIFERLIWVLTNK